MRTLHILIYIYKWHACLDSCTDNVSLTEDNMAASTVVILTKPDNLTTKHKTVNMIHVGIVSFLQNLAGFIATVTKKELFISQSTT